MSSKTASLQELYMEVTDETVLTESQEEGPSRDPIEDSVADIEQQVSQAAREDGLDDAVKGAENSTGSG